jgi:hypothetical protein
LSYGAECLMMVKSPTNTNLKNKVVLMDVLRITLVARTT